MSMLNALLAEGAVELHGRASDWREAIREAGALLERSGKTTSAYTEAMVTSVEDNGPYIVVAPGFAFAHARPSEAVKETAMSWVRLETPVEFGSKTNDPVNLVVALAATDASAHLNAMKELAGLLGKKPIRQRLDAVASEAELREILEAGPAGAAGAGTAGAGAAGAASAGAGAAGAASASTASAGKPAGSHQTAADSVPSKGKIYTVCGNGLGTSLFLKNTLEQVLDEWGWGTYFTVEATDTISAKGRAKEADFLLTSGEIAATLGDVGVPVHVIEDFTSMSEIDGALRELYDV
ncbi:PTS sugar transporter subunit IIA [uncultured Corynebacterium sp.]|uniref:PTS sugar transporter subunit IIA n=1 Tax=uncultured Corynebacterium sp. TaxID=159447 RepID=UPI0025F0F83B|nr:PTS sugar transporter subunit IIA [uncultured Corynebacterium sp.]